MHAERHKYVSQTCFNISWHIYVSILFTQLKWAHELSQTCINASGHMHFLKRINASGHMNFLKYVSMPVGT